MLIVLATLLALTVGWTWLWVWAHPKVVTTTTAHDLIFVAWLDTVIREALRPSFDASLHRETSRWSWDYEKDMLTNVLDAADGMIYGSIAPADVNPEVFKVLADLERNE